MHPVLLAGAAGARVLLVADHASNRVPPEVELGIDPALMTEHVAIDIGTEALARALSTRLQAPAVIAGVSRLVIDLNREPDAPGLIPASSDGHVIPGNADLSEAERARRLEAYHTPYHRMIEAMLASHPIDLIISLHSFTPCLRTRPEEQRPWRIGILYNEDPRAAAIAIAYLREQGLPTGDNQPYSGRLLNYTMNRHAEANGIRYLGIEIRQDELQTDAGVAGWVDRLAELVAVSLAAM